MPFSSMPDGTSHVSLSELKARLREAEQTLEAIRSGEVDAVVVGEAGCQQVFTLESADRPYRILVEQMQEGALTLSARGVVLYCNRRLAAILRLPAEQIMGSPFVQFIPDAHRRRFAQLLADSAEAGGRGEFVLAAADGSEVPVYLSFIDLPLENQRVICGVVTDLTSQKKAEDRRMMTEDSLQIALDAAEMGHWDFDISSNTVRRSSRHDEICGHTLHSRNWSLETYMDYVLPEHRDTVLDAVARAMKSGKLEFETRIRRACDGVVRWVRVTGRTYFDDGTPVRMAGVLSDITAQREIEDQLRQAQKMEAVGQLTGGLAHDFNNLLTVILGNLERAQGHVVDTGIARLLDHARQAAERGARLTQQLLVFSRRQSLQTQNVCVNDLLRELQVLIRRAVGEETELHLTMDPGLWHCETDPTQFESAILNLSINARDAMPQGGKLTIQTANITLSSAEAAMVPDASPGRYVRVSVADTGEGMAPSVVAHVFEPFFSTKDVGKGTGLGLSMVYGFARQSNGHVVIESEVGVGTAVQLFLPWAERPPAETAVAGVRESHRAAPATILVVEDDPHVRALVVGLVSDLGHVILEAENGIDALTLVDQRPDIEMLFSDIVMPKGVSGIELARMVRSRHPHIAVLLTSGFTSDDGISTGKSSEEFGILHKPYAPEELAAAVNNALAAARSRNAAETGPNPGTSEPAVLVIEDEMLISMTIEDVLVDLRCRVVGPFTRLEEALGAARTAHIDFALVDLNLGGDKTYAIADALSERQIPFAFMTGEDGASMPEPYRRFARLSKPFSVDAVERVLGALVSHGLAR